MYHHAQVSSTHLPVHPSLQMLQHDGNMYSKIGGGQQDGIYKTLLVKRHSTKAFVPEHSPRNEKLLRTEMMETGLHAEDYVWAPQRNPSFAKRKAVALHCVRRQPENGPVELQAVAAVDFLSGEVLINARLVPNLGWNGSCRSERLHGWREARANLFRHIDRDTVIVGHQVAENLEILRLLHKEIVDSQIVATTALGTPPRRVEHYEPFLENVCIDFLGIKIRQGAACPLENALASREIVLHSIQWPRDLATWAKEAETGLWQGRDERIRRRFAKRIKSAGSSAVHRNTRYDGPAAAHGDVHQRGYQDAYEAGFANGFKAGYKRRHEQAKVPEVQAEMDEALPPAKRQKLDESIQNADDDKTPSSHGEAEMNADTSQVARARGLLAHLMKDAKIREVIQMLNREKEAVRKEREAVRCQAGSTQVAADC